MHALATEAQLRVDLAAVLCVRCVAAAAWADVAGARLSAATCRYADAIGGDDNCDGLRPYACAGGCSAGS